MEKGSDEETVHIVKQKVNNRHEFSYHYFCILNFGVRLPPLETRLPGLDFRLTNHSTRSLDAKDMPIQSYLVYAEIGLAACAPTLAARAAQFRSSGETRPLERPKAD